jgi:hypothetical protein
VFVVHGDLPEEPHDDQNEDDDQQHVNKIASLRNPWNSGGPEVPQKPKNDEDNHEKFEHERFLSMSSARLTSVPLVSEFYSLLAIAAGNDSKPRRYR